MKAVRDAFINKDEQKNLDVFFNSKGNITYEQMKKIHDDFTANNQDEKKNILSTISTLAQKLVTLTPEKKTRKKTVKEEKKPEPIVNEPVTVVEPEPVTVPKPVEMKAAPVTAPVTTKPVEKKAAPATTPATRTTTAPVTRTTTAPVTRTTTAPATTPVTGSKKKESKIKQPDPVNIPVTPIRETRTVQIMPSPPSEKKPENSRPPPNSGNRRRK